MACFGRRSQFFCDCVKLVNAAINEFWQANDFFFLTIAFIMHTYCNNYISTV